MISCFFDQSECCGCRNPKNWTRQRTWAERSRARRALRDRLAMSMMKTRWRWSSTQRQASRVQCQITDSFASNGRCAWAACRLRRARV